MNTYLGIIHIHSIYSDGTGNIDTITKAAKKAGLDWIIITDHNCMEIEEGFINGICVIKAEEISPVDSNHYLAFGLKNTIYNDNPKEYTEEVRKQGGFGFAAHPDESSNRKNIYPPIKWLDKTIIPDGIEIWNWFSVWADNLCDKNIFSLAYAFLFKHNLITPPKKETLDWWDDLNNKYEKIIPASGGVDAHALKIKKYIIPLTIFTYDAMLKTITNAIFLEDGLSKDFNIAKKQILNSIQNGKCLIYNRAVNKEIPDIRLTNSSNVVRTGESIILDDNTYLRIKLNKKYNVNIIHNGKIVWSKNCKETEFLISQKGKYRVEISFKKLGFAYSNPIVVI